MTNIIYTMEQIKDIVKPIADKYNVESIYLFGSYARGDFDSESDIDIAILADVMREDEGKYNSEIVKITEEIYDKYGYAVVLSPIIINNSFFNEWKEHLPFYKNVVAEGVKIVA